MENQKLRNLLLIIFGIILVAIIINVVFTSVSNILTGTMNKIYSDNEESLDDENIVSSDEVCDSYKIEVFRRYKNYLTKNNIDLNTLKDGESKEIKTEDIVTDSKYQGYSGTLTLTKVGDNIEAKISVNDDSEDFIVAFEGNLDKVYQVGDKLSVITYSDYDEENSIYNSFSISLYDFKGNKLANTDTLKFEDLNLEVTSSILDFVKIGNKFDLLIETASNTHRILVFDENLSITEDIKDDTICSLFSRINQIDDKYYYSAIVRYPDNASKDIMLDSIYYIDSEGYHIVSYECAKSISKYLCKGNEELNFYITCDGNEIYILYKTADYVEITDDFTNTSKYFSRVSDDGVFILDDTLDETETLNLVGYTDEQKKTVAEKDFKNYVEDCSNYLNTEYSIVDLYLNGEVRLTTKLDNGDNIIEFDADNPLILNGTLLYVEYYNTDPAYKASFNEIIGYKSFDEFLVARELTVDDYLDLMGYILTDEEETQEDYYDEEFEDEDFNIEEDHEVNFEDLEDEDFSIEEDHEVNLEDLEDDEFYSSDDSEDIVPEDDGKDELSQYDLEEHERILIYDISSMKLLSSDYPSKAITDSDFSIEANGGTASLYDFYKGDDCVIYTYNDGLYDYTVVIDKDNKAKVFKSNSDYAEDFLLFQLDAFYDPQTGNFAEYFSKYEVEDEDNSTNNFGDESFIIFNKENKN